MYVDQLVTGQCYVTVNAATTTEYVWEVTETFHVNVNHIHWLFSSFSISDRRVNVLHTVQSAINIPVLFVCFAWLESNLAQLQAA